MNININRDDYILNLEDNEVAKTLVDMLPLDLNMNDLNENESIFI